VFARFDYIARRIVNANHSLMRATAMLGISDCVRHGIRLAIPQPTEWQNIGNLIDAAMIFARPDLIDVRVDPGL